MLATVATAAVGLVSTGTASAAPPVGQGFTVTAADLDYILEQIKIAEFHANNTTTDTGPCGALLGSGPNQIPSPLLSFGLRTVDGSCNNLQSGQERFGAADETFPRLTTPVFAPAGNRPADLFAPGVPAGPATSYAQTSGNVYDTEPRTISNLIVDQTSTNPAAVQAAGFPVRTQGNEGVVPCTTDPVGSTPGVPAGCVPSNQTLFIPNVTTDVGLSPPFNGLFTIFGQFFDHGLDKITNGGNGSVFVPLNADDPLVTRGPDGIAGNGDEVPEGLRWMQLTRGTIVAGPDGLRNAPNTDTPFVDQSQTYTSHASHQFFLREYDDSSGAPRSTGRFLDKAGDAQGLATWADVKAQALTKLGVELQDVDVNDIPMVVTDPYGNYIPGPLRGMPQYVASDGVTYLEGDVTDPVQTSDLTKIGTAFLNDIAHAAGPGTATTPNTPDDGDAVGGSLDPVVEGEYDDELLDLHAICGDGRCNENIALQAVHQVFHNEHNRLVADITTTLAQNTALRTEYQTVNLAEGPDRTFTYEERLFQAARFVTEMEYQHLVFEEFARKVQPAINPFEAFAFNQTDVNPAITAEFAHAVYRFGHSMLTEDIARKAPDGTSYDIPLLDGFLNPAEYYQGASGAVDARAAATAIIMGMSDQAGNEIDEFVTNVLRNNLLGLPLDLPAINMTRARSEGIPPLNQVRRQIFAATNDGQLAPYRNWVDFGQNLKHPESLVNFVAAYGTHDIITAETTVAGRRTAAQRIVEGLVLPGPDGDIADDPLTAEDETLDNVNPPEDSADFMFGTSAAWDDENGATTTGLDDVDLWVGGLAETTNPFGGLLGTTFNYVFENQLTNLQNGDRFYYLARTPGMNLRAQLEGNSFSELTMRNTDATTLKADPFATADCKFELGNLTGAGSSGLGDSITGPGSVNDDPASDCDENAILLRQADGTIEYRLRNSEDPPGINAQSVYNGRTGNVVDRIKGGNDNDTFWGGPGNDVIDGGSGDDVVLGGEGDDIITDLAGADVPKGGPGNDAIDGGIGDDIVMGGDGKDFTNGGANLNEHFLGEGDDFAIAGQGTDAVFGDAGDDWEEGGDQPDLLIGDSSTLFFDDHNTPGHDVLIGQGGDDDYDMEGGDDIGVGGPGVEKNAGASGWDWIIGQEDPQPQNQDLNLVIVNAPPANETRDRFNEVESLSGWDLDDTLRGDDAIPSQLGGAGFVGCDALDQAGLDRIDGLDALVPPLTVPLSTVTATSVTRHCLLSGNVWGEGNILLGGTGDDVLEGRGADDIIDGDRYLRVRLSIRALPDGTGTELATTSLMESVPTGSGWIGPLAGKTLQQAVFAGLVNPGQIVIVREIVTPPAGSDVDTARFAGNRAEFTITDLRTDPDDPRIEVSHSDPDATRARTPNDCPTAAPGCGTDIVRNVERLQFLDETVSIGTPVAEISVPSVDFGTRSTTAAALTRTVTVTNTGNGDLHVSGAAVAGPNATDFTVTNGCGTVLPAATCTVSVAFRTTATGPRSATLSISHDAAGSPGTVTLTGTGVVNSAPTGLPTVDDPTPTEGFVVGSTTTLIADADGLSGATFARQWQFSNAAGTVFTNVPGATAATFTPLQAQVGRRLRVVVTFVDDHGTTQTLTSSPTGVVGDLFPGVGDNDAGANTLGGTAGDDVYAGGPGADTLTTGAGQDLVSGDGGNDTVSTGADDDTIRFTGLLDGFDAVSGGGGIDTIEARASGTDIGLRSVTGIERITANGFTGVRIVGTTAAETLNFGAVDLVGIVSINGGGGIDDLTGSAGPDWIIGGAAADTIRGQDGADTLEGGDGADTILGQAGDDVIEGGAGADAVTPGGGQDRLRFTAPFGNDVVTGFDAGPPGGQDLIDLRGLGITTLTGNVTIAAVGGAGNTLVTISGGRGSIRLNGVAPAAVDATDFLLAP